MINPVLEFYNADSLSEIADKVTLWLNVYIDGEYAGRGELSVTLLGHEIAASHVQGVLRQVAADNDRVVSGGTFGFSFNFEDNKNEFIPSAKTKVSASKAYTF